MVVPGRLLARDFASMLLDIVPDAPCHDDTFACTLRTLVDYMVPATLVLAVCVALGFLLAISVSVLLARFDRARAPSRRRKRIVSGPVHTDGAWVRLVEDDQGRRVVEVLQGVNWRPTTRDLAQFALDVPVTTGSRS
jgi:uncharacterized membrane protein